MYLFNLAFFKPCVFFLTARFLASLVGSTSSSLCQHGLFIYSSTEQRVANTVREQENCRRGFSLILRAYFAHSSFLFFLFWMKSYVDDRILKSIDDPRALNWESPVFTVRFWRQTPGGEGRRRSTKSPLVRHPYGRADDNRVTHLR